MQENKAPCSGKRVFNRGPAVYLCVKGGRRRPPAGERIRSSPYAYRLLPSAAGVRSACICPCFRNPDGRANPESPPRLLLFRQDASRRSASERACEPFPEECRQAVSTPSSIGPSGSALSLFDLAERETAAPDKCPFPSARRANSGAPHHRGNAHAKSNLFRAARKERHPVLESRSSGGGRLHAPGAPDGRKRGK